MTEDRARLHTAVLVAPSKERRKLRKQRRIAEARLHAEQRKTALAAAKAKAEERAERRATVYLPKAGEPGSARLRTPGGFHLTRHQDTSATLAGAYPFVAEGGLGADGVFVGQDLYSGGSFVYDPWVLYARGIITAPNVVLAGIVGSGKSSLAKSLYTRSLPFGRRVYVPGDPKGEHTAVANAVGGRAIVLGHGLNTRLNPLDEGNRPSGLSDGQWASTVAARRRDLIGALAETVLARGLSPLEHTAIDIALTQTVRSTTIGRIGTSFSRILAPSADADGRLAQDGRLVGHALRRLVAGDLAGLFDGPSTVAFDPSLPMISLDLSRVTENSTLISVLMTCSSAWMESALLDPNGGQRRPKTSSTPAWLTTRVRRPMSRYAKETDRRPYEERSFSVRAVHRERADPLDHRRRWSSGAHSHAVRPSRSQLFVGGVLIVRAAGEGCRARPDGLGACCPPSGEV